MAAKDAPPRFRREGWPPAGADRARWLPELALVRRSSRLVNARQPRSRSKITRRLAGLAPHAARTLRNRERERADGAAAGAFPLPDGRGSVDSLRGSRSSPAGRGGVASRWR